MGRRLFTLILGFFIAFAPAFAQKNSVTLKMENVKLSEMLSAVEKQTGYIFIYKSDELDLDAPVFVNVQGAKVEDVLDNVLKEKVTYSISGRQIVLKGATEYKNEKVRNVTGIVSDIAGPMPGVSVMEAGTKNGTVTDFDGKFSITVSSSSSSLVFSSLGYVDQTIKLGSQTVVNVKMVEDAIALDDVVVVGYGTQSKKLISSSIASVKMDDIDRGAELDPVKSLQGRVTGISIASGSGIPGQAPNVIIRGVSSISGSSSPLYVVDGIPAESYPNINANDIESMEVLKDASATAIYGSRANSGVVIITTKSGKSGNVVVDVNATAGVASLAKDIRMANTKQYINVLQEAIDNYNVQTGNLKTLYVPDDLTDFDWVSSISRKASLVANANASVMGGSDKTKYFVSFGVEDQQGYLIKTNFAKYTARAKFNQTIAKWLTLNVNISGAFSRYDMTEETDGSLKVLRAAREEQPWYTPYYETYVNEKGKTLKKNALGGTYRTMSSDGLTRHNPLMCILEEDYYNKKYQLQGTLSFDITPFKGFKYTPSISGYSIVDRVTKKLTELNTERGFKDGWGALGEQKNNSFRYVIDNVVSYNSEWDRLTYSLMAGHSFEKYTYDNMGVRSDNYANSAYPSSSFNMVTSGANIYPWGISYGGYALESYFARVAFNWDNRYILNGSFRADGSTRFPKDSRFGFFPAGSFAWIISNEKFMPKSNVLNELKLRLSAGQTGSMAGIGNWASMDLVSAGSAYNGVAGLAFSTPAQGLKWEKSTKYDAGLDLEFFGGRLNATLDGFYSLTDDMLYNRPVIATSGYTTLTSNIGSMVNGGVELSLNGTLYQGHDFKWTLGGNISYVKNRLVHLLDDKDIIIVSGSSLYGGTKHAIITGQPIGTWYMLKAEGLYQTDEEVPDKLYEKGVRAGDVKYYDVNGDGDIDYDHDRTIVGKATPDFFGGLNTALSWKGLQLDVFCQYSVGGQIFAAWKGAGQEGTEHLGLSSGSVTDDDGNGHTAYFNVSEAAATKYWRGKGTSNAIPRPVLAGVHKGWDVDYNILTSTRFLESASYFKVKTVTLSYNLPNKVLNRMKMSGFKLFATIDNALTFTKYDGYDPEMSISGSPASNDYGSDFGYEPVLRSYLFGISLKF